MWQRKQGLEVPCLPSTFHTAIPPSQQLKQRFSTKDSLGCPILLFAVVWVFGQQVEGEKENRNTSG